MEESVHRREQNLEFTILAKQIDSTLDPDLSAKLKNLEHLNLFSKVIGNVELMPVGSCIDGSKINLPNDGGDIDILIVPKRVILKESLFDYDKMHPAFLHIRINDEHEKYFKTVKNPIDGVYLPATVLKDRALMFILSRVFLMGKNSAKISEDGKYLNVTRSTSVGKELLLLNTDILDALGIKKEKDTLKFRLARAETFFSCTLRGMINMRNNSKETADIEYRNKNSNLNKSTSVLELFHKFLDVNDVKQAKDITDKSKSVLKEDNQSVFSHESKSLQAQNTETVGRKKARSGEFYPGNAKETPEMSDSANPTTRKVYSSSCDENISTIAKNASCQTETLVKRNPNEMCTTGPQKYTNEPSMFSILKSADFVPVYRFEGWPRTAEEWLMRQRKWPAKTIVKKVLEGGCQVVAKRPKSSYHDTEFHATAKTDERDPYFRLSFSLSEIILTQSMKEQQLLCLRVLKAYQKCFLKTTTKFLTSYHWKNVVFWVSEDLEEIFWIDENVLTAVVKCIDYMMVCLRERNLPFYFVRRMNLFHGFETMLVDRMLLRLEEIRKMPLEYLKRFINNPPRPETYLLSINEIQRMLSKDEKALHDDEMIHDSVRLLFLSRLDLDEVQNAFAEAISKFRSDVTTQKPGHTKEAQRKDILREKMLTVTENMIALHKDKKGSNKKNTFGDSWKSLAHTLSLTEESEKPSAKKMTQIVSDMFREVAPTSSSSSKDKTCSTNLMLTSLQTLVTVMLEETKSQEQGSCTDANEEETREGNILHAAIYKALQKSIKAAQKSGSKVDKEFSIIDEFKQISESFSQELGMGNRSEKQRSKTAMHIELD